MKPSEMIPAYFEFSNQYWQPHVVTLLAQLAEKYDDLIWIDQIKEKFGQLSIYFIFRSDKDGNNFATEDQQNEIQSMVDAVEHLCNNLCDSCGFDEDIKAIGPYYNAQNLCVNCRFREKLHKLISKNVHVRVPKTWYEFTLETIEKYRTDDLSSVYDEEDQLVMNFGLKGSRRFNYGKVRS